MKRALLWSVLCLCLLCARRAQAQQVLAVWHAYRGDEKVALEQVLAAFEKREYLKVEALQVPHDAYAAKLTAADKRADATMKAYAKSLPKLDVATLRADLDKARAKFKGAMPKAELKGDCLTTGDAVAIAGAVDPALDVVMAAARVVERTTVVRSSPLAPPETENWAWLLTRTHLLPHR